MGNAYENQAFNGRPTSSSMAGLAIGQPIMTSAGKGRITNIERASSGGNVNPVCSSYLDPFLITIVLDDTQEVVTELVSTFAFQTYNGAVPFID